jgi:hypothetical protein
MTTHRLFSNLKRWGLGVYHGLRRVNLQHYLDEFVFRFKAGSPDAAGAASRNGWASARSARRFRHPLRAYARAC